MKTTPTKEEAKASITIREFLAQFSDDEKCLEHLFQVRFGQGHTCPKCSKASKWFRFQAERAYACQWCGHHLHPTVGTPFEDSRTPLQLWFYAIYLFATSRHGVPAKELERQLGVTYKTAWRMAHLIRQHMEYVDGEFPLFGDVEIDETYGYNYLYLPILACQTFGREWRELTWIFFSPEALNKVGRGTPLPAAKKRLRLRRP
jgi:transposase-like protein